MKISDAEIATVVREAADAIDTFGWNQGSGGDEEIGFCALGAIYHAARPHQPLGVLQSPFAHLVVGGFRDWMKENEFLGPTQSISDWNDFHCKGPEEVTLYLRKFADEKGPQCEQIHG